MQEDSGNLQNEFFNAVRKDRKEVAVFLSSGKRLVGRLKAFDKFTILLEGPQGEHIVFKHAISTVSLAREEDRRAEEVPARGRVASPAGGARSGS
jgi:host factor-I protein